MGINNPVACEKLKVFFDKYCDGASGKSFLIAISGGKDSMVLAHLMLDIRKKVDCELHAFHLDHNTRNGESEKDAIFVQGYCDENRITYHGEKHVFNNSSNFEEQARIVRYNCIEKLLEKYKIDFALTAHTLSDSIETVLMRIFRGTSVHGLQGIPVKRKRYLRPLLHYNTDEIMDYADRNHIVYRHDYSNEACDYDRNFIRNRVIPLIETRFPLESSVKGLISSAVDTSDLIIKAIKRDIEYRYENDSVVLKKFNGMDDLSQFKHTFAFLIRDVLNMKITSSLLSELYRNYIVNKTHLTIYKNNELEIKKTLLNNEPVIIFSKGFNNSSEIRPSVVSAKIINRFSVCYSNKDYFVRLCDYDQNKEVEDGVVLAFNNQKELILRPRIPGDRICHNKMTVKLKKICINLKMSAEQKNRVIVVTLDNKVAAFIFDPYLDNYMIDDSFLTFDKTKKILAINCRQK
ncbi:MAG: tRNA lysidine(34) synthetase TilS [Spirochaetes bacterium]|nr:tRNA lysidine(34) synthetase TilS [Spirochaetota bacterium]MBN2769819.1 tRNA lysidine(34) synthetase TilS [Spirochaetota bacterium]